MIKPNCYYGQGKLCPCDLYPNNYAAPKKGKLRKQLFKAL